MSEWTCQVLQLLDRFTVADLLEKRLQTLVTLRAEQSPAEAMRTLLEKEITSAPIVEREGSQPLGFLDIRRLLKRVMKKKEVLRETTGATMRALARHAPYRPVKLSASVATAAAVLGTGVHRVPVIDDESGDVVGIISQIDIVTFLFKHLDELPEEGNAAAVLNSQVMQGSCGTSPVAYAPRDMSAESAFNLLGNKQLASVPIVDQTGTMVGKISAHDVERFLLGDFSAEQLQQNIVDYLHSLHDGDVIPDHASDNLVSDEGTTVRDCIIKMARARRHHLFVVGAGTQMPLRVVSVGDLVRTLTKHNDWKLAELRALSFFDAEEAEQA
ncbi:MAG: hypothetical protein MHM6MM_001937 [Cercozoa sp. M6MM]